MPSPQTCAHCASAFAMTNEAFQKRIPPPDVVRGALLLGVAVGSEMTGDVKECAECRQQIETIKQSIRAAAAAAEAAQQPGGAAAQAGPPPQQGWGPPPAASPEARAPATPPRGPQFPAPRPPGAPVAAPAAPPYPGPEK